MNEEKIIELLATGYSTHSSNREKKRAVEKPSSSGILKFIFKRFQDPVAIKKYEWLKGLIDNSYESAKYIDINNISVDPDEVYASAGYKEAIRKIRKAMKESSEKESKHIVMGSNL